MLNYLWAFMILAGTVFGMCTGRIDAITDALLTGGGEAIDLSMTLFGVISLWMGLMKTPPLRTINCWDCSVYKISLK